MSRRERKARVHPMIAYDLETTRIARGTPKPLYLTAYGADMRVSVPITSLEHLRDMICMKFLIPEYKGVRFVAWNANNFDVYFIGMALLQCPEYELRPYLTRSKNLRGLRVTLKNADPKKRVSWEFLDGMAMTVGTGVTLKKFLGVFAPEFGKLEAPDWEREEFNPKNPAHQAYAERDSEGLYHAMNRAQEIVLENFGVPLQPTIGNTAIRVFQANMKHGLNVWSPGWEVAEAIRRQAMRGGFCHIQRKYSGPVWKYDLNQAYAAAMRDAWLPGGRAFAVKGFSRFSYCGLYRVKATHAKGCPVPFYWIDDKGDSQFTNAEIGPTWLTSIETEQLRREGWKMEVQAGYAWEEAFTMREYVDKLEKLRTSAADGPSGALGTMVKSIGNNSYGKTVEMLDGIEFMLAADKPAGFHEYQPDEDCLQNVYFRFKEPQIREYHQPQIGAFITAQVRMEVRRAALLAPEAFLYADTDCVVFDCAVDLPIDAKRYGYWKIEEAGEHYYMVTKKVYARQDGSILHAKGMNVKRLTKDDFAMWYAGRSPVQKQVQRQNWVKVMTGAPMFAERERRGQIGLDG